MSVLMDILSTILKADSYKVSHWFQYPEKTEYVSSYIEARKSIFAEQFGEEYNFNVFFGLQAFLKDHLSVPIEQVDIDIAELLYEAHGEPFNKEGWQYILDEYDGKLPVEIRALPEGTVTKTGTALVDIINTDPKCFWLTSYIETSMLRAVWYPTTVATLSRVCKEICRDYLQKTCDTPDEVINFMLHDFGDRGASVTEAAALGGMSHLVNFMGTDTIEGIIASLRYYDEDFETFLKESPEKPKEALLKLLKKNKAEGKPLTGFSVIASEHSTMTIKGKNGEKEQIKKLIDKAKEGNIVSIVSDSYDYWKNVETVFSKEFKDDIIEAGNNGGRIVIRPDSGDTVSTIVDTVEILAKNFGTTVNKKKGYKVLPPYIRVLQGDGINPVSMRAILEALEEKGFSAENVVMGMGGGLLQKLDRDTLGFAQKASYAKIDGEEYDVYKDPATKNIGFSKKSKKGKLATIFNGKSFITKRQDALKKNEIDRLQPVFRNGEILKEYDFNEIRQNAEYFTDITINAPQKKIKDPWQEAKLAA